MIFEIDILIPEIIIFINLVVIIILPFIFSKQNNINNLIPKQEISLNIFSLVCCIFSLLFLINNNTVTSLFGYHIYINNITYCAKLLVYFFAIILLIMFIYIKVKKKELFIIVLCGILGASFTIMAGDLIILYLGLELLSLSTYIMIASKTTKKHSIEAGIKYILFSALSSGFILLAISLVYGYIGTTAIFIRPFLLLLIPDLNMFIINTFFLVGFSFKLGLFPFHNWVPDIYQGAPIYAVTFLTLIPKIVYLSFLSFLTIQYQHILIPNLLIFISIFSIIFSSIAAINQTYILRILAYSSINNLGLTVLPLFIGNLESILISGTYLIIYLVLNTIIFSIISIVPISTINDINILNKYPLLAFCFT